MLLLGLLIVVVLFLALFVVAVSAFLELRREVAVRREFGQSSALECLVLLYPLWPLAFIFGLRFLPVRLLLVLIASFFFGVLFVASAQRHALERSGTDRVNGALYAISSVTLGAIIGIVDVALVGVIVLVAQALDPQWLGA